jgi:hypothetical protein
VRKTQKKREDHLIFINFGIKLFPQVLIFFLVENWIPLTKSEIAEIGQKNRRNFRG